MPSVRVLLGHHCRFPVESTGFHRFPHIRTLAKKVRYGGGFTEISISATFDEGIPGDGNTVREFRWYVIVDWFFLVLDGRVGEPGRVRRKQTNQPTNAPSEVRGARRTRREEAKIDRRSRCDFSHRMRGCAPPAIHDFRTTGEREKEKKNAPVGCDLGSHCSSTMHAFFSVRVSGFRKRDPDAKKHNLREKNGIASHYGTIEPLSLAQMPFEETLDWAQPALPRTFRSRFRYKEFAYIARYHRGRNTEPSPRCSRGRKFPQITIIPRSSARKGRFRHYSRSRFMVYCLGV